MDEILRRVVGLLPTSFKSSLVTALAQDQETVGRVGRSLLASLARQVGIDGVRASGSYGEIISSPADMKVLSSYARRGKWSESIVNVFDRHFTERSLGSYVDVGANIGLTTIPIARKHAQVSCFAIEPDPTNFHNLRSNIRLNCLANNVSLYNVAALDRDLEAIEFELCAGNLGDHRVRREQAMKGVWGEERRPTIRVKAARLDTILPRMHGSLGVKIDTQGCEPFVFEGGCKVLSSADLIHFEWWPYSMNRLRANPAAAATFVLANFRNGSMVEGESDEAGEIISISALSERLLTVHDRFKNAPKAYFDVTVFK